VTARLKGSVGESFDDGLLSAYNAAQRVLNPLGVKAIFFIPTAILDFTTREQMQQFTHARILFGKRALDALRPEEYITMSTEHLQELHEQGHMILPHTHSHVLAREITTSEDVVLELMRPKLILEDLLRSPVDAMAIPVGTPSAVSEYSYRQIASIYSVCFTALGGPNTRRTDPRFLRRDSIHPWYSIEHARNIVDGIFDPYFALRMKALHRRTGGRYMPARRETQADRKPAAAQATADGRTRFVARVADAFEQVGVEYVFLHGYRHDGGVDSDLDIAVARGSLNLTDALIRSGAFGRVVQYIHYGVPWCRQYAFEVEEPGRRYRQLDVACDPWGIGHDGPAVRVALSSRVLSGGMRLPAPAAEAFYLSVRRARKRRYGLRDQAELRRVFRRDPGGAATLLERHFGVAGARLAEALEHRKPDLSSELDALRRVVVRQRRSPVTLARRLVFDPPRIIRRLLRPTGLVVSIVGPDAVCMSLVAGLERETEGVLPRMVFLQPVSHHGVTPAGLPARRQPDSADAHAPWTPRTVGSTARAVLLGLGVLIAWWPRVALGRARASLVIIDGGSLDLTDGSSRNRSLLPLWLISILRRALPQPDITLVIERSSGPTRKKPGDGAETEHARDTWRELASRAPDKFMIIDGSSSVETTLQRALEAIGDRLAARQHGLRACTTPDEPPERQHKPDVLLSPPPAIPPDEANEPRSKPMTGTKRAESGGSG